MTNKGEGERGERAGFDRRSGAVHGSGAGAGGGGTPGEDYDADSAGGGGAEPQGGPRPIDEAKHDRRDRHQGHYG